MSLPPPPTDTGTRKSEDKTSSNPLLTEEEFQILEEDRQQAIDNANAVYKVKVKTKDKVVSKSKAQWKKERDTCLEFLRSKMRAADPEKKTRFSEMVEGVEF